MYQQQPPNQLQPQQPSNVKKVVTLIGGGIMWIIAIVVYWYFNH